MKSLVTGLFILFMTGVSYAEGVKDTVILGDVVKLERASNQPQSYESPFTDMKYLKGARLSDALGEYSSVYIKKYGAGQLASIAIRGTSATQTEIQWNGVRLNSPALGQLDLSLLHIGIQDELELVRTGFKGIIGGTLMLNNEVKMDSGFSLGGSFRAGSFKTFEAVGEAHYAKAGFYGTSRFCYLTSSNDYRFRNTFEENHPYRKQTNASLSQLSFLQQFGIRFKRTHSVNFYLWLTDASREIPPIMSKPEGKESQQDGSLRLMADWKGRFKNLKVKFSSAYLRDKIRYRNPDALLDETTFTGAFRNIFSATYYFPFQLSLNAELNYDHETANVRSYGIRRERNIAGIKVYADYCLFNRFRFHAGFREDVVDRKFSAFAPELAFSYTPSFHSHHRFTVGGIASRNFRFPTLNDLYWVPGGNRDLKQERSWNGDVQLKYGYKNLVDISLSNFYIYASDWIQWTPNGSIWTPVNVKSIFSRGVEATLHVTNQQEGRQRQLVFHLNTSYSFTRTTNLDAASHFDNSKGKQLIYVPVHQVMTGLQIQYRKFYVRSTNRFTDRVFTSTDNSQSLKGYCIADLEFGKDLMLPHLEVGLSLRLNNIGNSSYQVVAQRPMPGRNYEITLRFKFQ